MMKRELFSHKLSYATLIIFLGLAGFLFLAAWPDRAYQRYLTVFLSVFYLFWGVVVHLKRKELSSQIFFEYLGASVLAGSILYLITL